MFTFRREVWVIYESTIMTIKSGIGNVDNRQTHNNPSTIHFSNYLSVRTHQGKTEWPG